MRAEETLRSVVVGIFNDFLDGDLEMVRTLLRKSLHTGFVRRVNVNAYLSRGSKRPEPITTTWRRRD